MENKRQHNSVYILLGIFATAVIIVGLLCFFTIDHEDEVIQGQIDVEVYRVTAKVPSRMLKVLVREGDFVRAGDTLCILEASTIDKKTNHGANKLQKDKAYALLKQAKAGLDVYKKSYERIQRRFDEGTISEQKLDEAYALYKAYDVQEKAAERAVKNLNSYIQETVKVSQMNGEVAAIYPKVGELIEAGSPIMTISIMNKLWARFNMREDQLNGLKNGEIIKAFLPAFNQEIDMKVTSIRDDRSYSTNLKKDTKSNSQNNMKTFEVKARPTRKFDGLRPGMSVIIK